MRAYVVQRGEDLASIAARMGFDPAAVWAHERNRALRELRRDPGVLARGDVLYVPAARSERAHVDRNAENRYRGPVPEVRLRVVLRGCGGEALANEPYRIEGLRSPIEGVSDGSGIVARSLPGHVRDVRIVVPRLATSTALRLGDLDPLDEESGIRQRLALLGYLVPDRLFGRGPERRVSPAALRHAIRDFQRDGGLPITGRVDAATREALFGAHGA